MAAAVTESLPNLKTGTASKREATMEARIHATSKAIWRQKPCVVMKRADSDSPVVVTISDGRAQRVVQASVSHSFGCPWPPV